MTQMSWGSRSDTGCPHGHGSAEGRIHFVDYGVLDTALRFSAQPIENDLDPARNPESRFMIITDPSRVESMRSTTRKIQRVNYIPSRFSMKPYRREIMTQRKKDGAPLAPIEGKRV